MYVPAVPPAPPVLAKAPLMADPVALGISATALAPRRTAIAISWRKLDTLAGRAALVRGRLLTQGAGLSGEDVLLQAWKGRRWSTLAGARTGAAGRFLLRYLPRRIGSERVRVRFSGAADLPAARRALGRLNVYRPVQASWYGGGGGLACGGSLTGATMGVASRTLPCGMLVTLHFQGRSVRVPVVDRGPYVEGREFDLTEATKLALRFGDTGELWSTS